MQKWIARIILALLVVFVGICMAQYFHTNNAAIKIVGGVAWLIIAGGVATVAVIAAVGVIKKLIEMAR